MRSDATEMTGSITAKIRAGQKNVAHRKRHQTAGAHWLFLSAEKIAMRCVCMADTQPAKHDLFLSVRAQTRTPGFESWLELSELIMTLRIPLPLPLGAYRSADNGVEIPCRKRQTASGRS